MDTSHHTNPARVTAADSAGRDTTALPGPPATTAPNVRQWLVLRRNAGSTPAEITAELVRGGWDADTAASTALHSLRSTDRQSLLYATCTAAAGIAALSAGSAAHLTLAGNPLPLELTLMLTVFLVATPIAGVTGAAARRVEQRSDFVLWSPTRRGWFGALALCTAAVGVFRLLNYLFTALATLTGASDRPFDAADAGQVAVTLGLALPLFWWSFTQWRRSNLVISALGSEESAAPHDGAGAERHPRRVA